jgi:hypothetical protein
MTIEKIIQKFVSERVLDQASKVEQNFRKKGFDRDYIRVGIRASGRPNKREDIYFVSPGGSIDEGPSFHSQGDSYYSLQNVGDIQIRIIRDYEMISIKIDRIIQPADEDMTYADRYETALFLNLTTRDRKNLIDESERYGTIVECRECYEKILLSQEAVENGKYTPLNDPETIVVCKSCAGDYTVGEYLESLSEEDKEAVGYYLLNYCQLEKEDLLVL